MSADGLRALQAVPVHVTPGEAMPGPAILRTIDGGKTWTKARMLEALPLGTLIMEIALSADGRVGLAVDRLFTWRSDDGGETWSRAAAGLDGASLLHVGLALSADGRRGMALTHAMGNQFVHVTQDGGATWAKTPIKRQEFDSYWRLALSADGLRGIMIGQATHPVLRTSDGGTTWQPFDPPGRSVPYWAYAAIAVALASIAALIIGRKRRAAA
jgi:photosystem II stability/assembly factor-like uncharacterized protein